jgi:uncharacterized protein
MSEQRPTALITGASSGIGATYADRLAKRGHDLILVARDAGRLEALAGRLRAESGVRVDVLAADLTAQADLAKVEDRLRSDPQIGILVNNAGAASEAGFGAADLNPLYQLVDLNVVALTRLAGAAVQGFLQHGISGAVINLSSVLAFIPGLLPGVYGATKAYALTLSEAMNAELGSKGIYIQAVLPGGTKTEIWERSGRSVRDEFMDVGELVDAALVGFDRREPVTIPPLQDAAFYQAYEAARAAMQPQLANSHAAPRYRA